MFGGSLFRPLTEPPTVVTDFSPEPAPSPEPFWLTDDLLFHHQRCQRRAYLNIHGDRAEADPPSDYLQKIKQDSAEHPGQGAGGLRPPTNAPPSPPAIGGPEPRPTVALMAAGADAHCGRCLAGSHDPKHLSGQPPRSAGEATGLVGVGRLAI
jgi:hypothetical protein